MTTYRTILIEISPFAPTCEILEVLEDREKSFKVRNRDNPKHWAYLPKSGLQLRKPGVPTYEDEYTVKPWLRARLSCNQERLLGILE